MSLPVSGFEYTHVDTALLSRVLSSVTLRPTNYHIFASESLDTAGRANANHDWVSSRQAYLSL